jgi:hypothetical protein
MNTLADCSFEYNKKNRNFSNPSGKQGQWGEPLFLTGFFYYFTRKRNPRQKFSHRWIMPIRNRDREALDDDEFPEPDEDDPNFLCPYCRVPIFEESEKCPHCGTWLTDEENDAGQRKPLWIIVGAVACLVVVYFWLRNPG